MPIWSSILLTERIGTNWIKHSNGIRFVWEYRIRFMLYTVNEKKNWNAVSILRFYIKCSKCFGIYEIPGSVHYSENTFFLWHWATRSAHKKNYLLFFWMDYCLIFFTVEREKVFWFCVVVKKKSHCHSLWHKNYSYISYKYVHCKSIFFSIEP